MHGLRRDLLRIHLGQDVQRLETGLDAGTLGTRTCLALRNRPVVR